jgi:hypothetical protein
MPKIPICLYSYNRLCEEQQELQKLRRLLFAAEERMEGEGPCWAEDYWLIQWEYQGGLKDKIQDCIRLISKFERIQENLKKK